jgi:hypothetical protein
LPAARFGVRLGTMAHDPTDALNEGADPADRGGIAGRRSSTVGPVPEDPAGEAAADAIAGMLQGASVELVYSPLDAPPPAVDGATATATAEGAGPAGWRVTCTVRLGARSAALVSAGSSRLQAILDAAPAA